MDKAFSKLEIDKALRPQVFRLVDKLDKLAKEDWLKFALDSGLTEAQTVGLLQLLEDSELWRESDELIEFFDLIKSFGVADYLEFNPKVIRGLDYYTGTVFEAYELGGQSRAILGGGRYDNLVADVGGNRLPGVGFAMGDVVIELVLRDKGVIPERLGNKPQVMVTVFDQATLKESILVTNKLRAAGYRVMIYPEADKLGKQFKFADRLDIPVAVVLGPDELEAGKVAVKDLKSREQVSIHHEELLDQIEEFLRRLT
jgi:histidyl-tRNA synthetase